MTQRVARFLVDATSATGLGHLRRSEVLLRAMMNEGFDCTLYCQEPSIARAIGLPAYELPKTPRELAKCDVIICDSYTLGSEALREFRQQSKILLAFDDLGNKPLPADIVLNHNIYGDTVDYSHAKQSIVLAGDRYTLVRAEILEAARKFSASRPSNNVVVSFGGTDNGDRAAPVVESLLKTSADHISVVIAPGNHPSEAIGILEAQNPTRLRIRVNPDLPKLLSDARLYVGAGGMTATEAHIIGLDMIVCVIADNQKLNARAFEKFGHHVFIDVDPTLIARCAGQILNSALNRRQTPIDGRGANRVIQVISRLLGGYN